MESYIYHGPAETYSSHISKWWKKCSSTYGLRASKQKTIIYVSVEDSFVIPSVKRKCKKIFLFYWTASNEFQFTEKLKDLELPNTTATTLRACKVVYKPLLRGRGD